MLANSESGGSRSAAISEVIEQIVEELITASRATADNAKVQKLPAPQPETNKKPTLISAEPQEAVPEDTPPETNDEQE